MDHLTIYAEIAEIFGAVAIVGGAVFGVFQLSEYRRRRRSQVAADLCRAFAEPELAKAVTLLKSLPDGVPAEDLRAREGDVEQAAQIVGMSFETMGLLVYRDIASFEIVRELTGGLLLMMWRKIEPWVQATRAEQGNPRFGEWFQWLAERIAECEADMTPAYQAHANWRPGRRGGRSTNGS